MMFLPACEIIEIIMNPPQTITVIINPLRLQPLSCKLPDEEVSVVKIFVSWITNTHCLSELLVPSAPGPIILMSSVIYRLTQISQ